VRYKRWRENLGGEKKTHDFTEQVKSLKGFKGSVEGREEFAITGKGRGRENAPRIEG